VRRVDPEVVVAGIGDDDERGARRRGGDAAAAFDGADGVAFTVKDEQRDGEFGGVGGAVERPAGPEPGQPPH